MNERIKELAEHANYLATEKEFPYDEDWFYLYNKKFAELIIKECAGVCEDYRGTEWGKAAECIGDSIKEHFGVEE
jgi:hypothetical protein